MICQPKTYLFVFALPGLIFGFALPRMGAGHYDSIPGAFLLQDCHIFGVIGSAIVIADVAFGLIEKLAAGSSMDRMIINQKWPVKQETIYGGLIFGLGWGIAGFYRGTVLAMIGEGKIAAMVAFGGVLTGTSPCG